MRDRSYKHWDRVSYSRYRFNCTGEGQGLYTLEVESGTADTDPTVQVMDSAIFCYITSQI